MAVYRHKNPSKSDSVQKILYERRVLMFVTAINIVGVIVWLTAVATDYWIVVFPKSIALSTNGTNTHLWSHHGLWRECVYYGTPLDSNPLEGVVTSSNCKVGSDDVVFKAEVTGKVKKEIFEGIYRYKIYGKKEEQSRVKVSTG